MTIHYIVMFDIKTLGLLNDITVSDTHTCIFEGVQSNRVLLESCDWHNMSLGGSREALFRACSCDQLSF